MNSSIIVLALLTAVLSPNVQNLSIPALPFSKEVIVCVDFQTINVCFAKDQEAVEILSKVSVGEVK